MKPHSTRPLHKRLALHPMTVMGLLCLGVFIVGSTFRAQADTVHVTAEVHATPLTSPAVITSLHDQQHVTQADVDVAGTCPADSYVKLFVNNVFAGVAQCQNGGFRIPTTLSPGANRLEVRAYNITDDPGPLSPAITVYYDNVAAAQASPSTSQSLPKRTEPGVSPLLVSADYRYQTHFEGEEWHWDISIGGGIPPYKVAIDWGDGNISNRDRDDSNTFTISHAYEHAGIYYPTIRVIDQNGKSNRSAVMQLLAIVKPVNGAPMVSSVTPAGGIGHYLWIIWPAYIAILLMVCSFWLGEQEVVRKLRLRRH